LKQKILEGHNKRQIEALTHLDGPALILSGPGSGKTEVVACRYLYLLNSRKMSSEEVLVLTLSPRAAFEVKNRIFTLSAGACQSNDDFNNNFKNLKIDTFQTICCRILRDEIKEMGFGENFIIYSEEDRFGLIRSILKEFKIHEALFRGIAARISNLKVEMVGHEEFLANGGGFGFEEKLAKVYMRYQSELQKNNCLDQDDLIMYTVNLFQEHESVLKKWQNKISQIMVDDFQDINPAQYSFIKYIGKQSGNVFITADDDQGILGFRGARLEHINRFKEDFTSTRVIRFEQSYRCTPYILEAAGAVIGGNPGPHKKKLESDRNFDKHKPQYFCGGTETDEASYIAHTVRELFLKGSYAYRDFGLLYRMSTQLRSLEKALRDEGIPYYVHAAYPLYRKSEVKDAIAYAKMVMNPDDSVSFGRIINSPPRGIGVSTLAKMIDSARKDGVSLFNAFKKTSSVKKSQAKVKKLIDLVIRTRKSYKDAGKVIDVVLNKSGYMKWLSGEKDADVRLANIKMLIEEASGLNLHEFLDYVALFSEDNEVKNADAVSLMTVYEAQGLEFPVVYMAGLEEGLLPHSHARQQDNGKAIEEERRLLYVGMTRARDVLYLTGAAKRRFYTRIQLQEPSRFLKDLSEELCCTVRHASSANGSADFHVLPKKPKKIGRQIQFSVGVRVKHITWGNGVVRDLAGQGDSAKVTVNFPSVGIKCLSLKFANLEVI